MSNRSTILRNWPKYLLQWGTLAVLIAFAAGWIPVGDLLDGAVKTNLAENLHPANLELLQILKGVALVACFVLFSRLFCGYLCPLGTIQDLIIKGREAIRMKSLKISNGSIVDKILRIFKYALLFAIFYLAIYTQGLFPDETLGSYPVPTREVNGELIFWISIGLLTLVIPLTIFADMFWCRYICPLGALSNSLKFWGWILLLCGLFYGANLLTVRFLALTVPWEVFLGTYCLAAYFLEIFDGKPKFLAPNIVKDNVACNNCGACIRKCPYHIHLRDFHNAKVNHIDCTLCGECIAACPPGALNIGLNKPVKFRPAKFIPALITTAIVLSILYLIFNS